MGKLAGERTSVAAAVLGFYMSIYFLTSLQAPAGWGPAFAGMAGTYAVGFFGLVAGYFWARWFCIGLGISGLITALMAIWQIGPEPVLVFYGGTHGAISLALWGTAVADRFDGQDAWRERYHLDENATHRLGKSIIRVGVSLPYIVLYALAPRESDSLLLTATAALVGAGVWGLLRVRSWGLLALTGGAVVTLVTSVASPVATSFGTGWTGVLWGAAAPLEGMGLCLGGLGFLAAVTMLAATVGPFAGPVARYLVRRA